jgi:general secretion pathway protein J
VTHRGFTLIELMVAVLITAIIAVMGYTAINQAAVNRVQVEAQTARVIEVQRGLRTLAQDIEELAPRPVREPLGNGVQPALVAGTANGAAGMASASNTTSNLALQALAILSLTRGGWANPSGLQRPEEQRVHYLLEKDVLVRYHLPVLDAAGEMPAVRHELIHGVTSISFRYMDAGHAWQTNWHSGLAAGNGRQPLMRERPVAVEITLKLQDWGTITRIIEVAG